MPGLDELQWREYVDFTGGLWERGNDRECAPNGLLESTDCYPLQHGGLRPFMALRPIKTKFPRVLPPETVCYGVWYRGCYVSETGFQSVTVEPSTTPGYFVFRLWGPDNLSVITEEFLEGAPSPFSTSDGSWVEQHTQDFLIRVSTGMRFEWGDLGGQNTLFFNYAVNTTVSTAIDGLYRNSASTQAFLVNQLPNNYFSGGPFWIHQNRIMRLSTGSSTGLSTPRGGSIFYNNPGSTVFSTAQMFQPHGQHPGELWFLAPTSPSDLVTMKSLHSMVNIQGSITAPTVRDIEYTHTHPIGYPIHTDIGLVLVMADLGAVVLTGSGLQPISQPILGCAMGGKAGTRPTFLEGNYGFSEAANNFDADVPFGGNPSSESAGQLGAYGPFIFFFGGYMMDTRTNAWFKQSSVTNPRVWQSDPDFGRMYVSTGNNLSQGPFMYWGKADEDQWVSMDVYSFTLPLLFTPMQKTAVREIEYHINTVNDCSSVEVELSWMDPNGQVQTKIQGPYTLPSAAPHKVRVVVGGQPADWWKIRTIMKSNRSGVSAPTLERMFCGTQPATRYEVAS